MDDGGSFGDGVIDTFLAFGASCWSCRIGIVFDASFGCLLFDNGICDCVLRIFFVALALVGGAFPLRKDEVVTSVFPINSRFSARRQG